ncbi:hypothetical protein [Microcoleus sp. K5-D4]|uniref:hypothetical protein n=1 Tax=Microcoleus sp. K5-D4 TaxID=2818801 RepID=UPI002FCF2083
MPSNPRKLQPNLAKPSEGNSFNAGKKPTEAINPLQGLNISAEREIGSAGGIKATGTLTVGIDNLIAQQGLTVEADATNKTLGVGLNVGSPKGKLGVNIGGKIGYDEQGKMSIRGAEAGVNIAGFGGSASIDDEKGITGSISVAGAKIEVTVAPDGKKTLSLCYGVPGGELCVTFEPDPEQQIPIPPPPPPPPLTNNKMPAGWEPTVTAMPNSTLTPGSYYLRRTFIGADGNYYYDSGNGFTIYKVTPPQTGNLRSPSVNPSESKPEYCFNITQSQIDSSTVSPATGTRYRRAGINGAYALAHLINRIEIYSAVRYISSLGLVSQQNETYYRRMVIISPYGGSNGYKVGDIVDPSSLVYWWMFPNYGEDSFWQWMNWELIQKYTIELVSCEPPAPVIVNIQLPNTPPIIKPMNECCDKVNEMYKYLGIAKMKKKFKVANQFLAPGATGNTECEDYYALQEALFRMLANGLIINPTSAPNGTPWQSANATAWAGQMYEMMAESMSDGNSTQKVEIAIIMQLAQLMKVNAEQTRMIQFLSECIGITPELDTEDVPICFTIHEAHKGFGKKDKKLIDINAAKTDNQVESVLATMLQPSKIPISTWKFKPDSISIIEALRQL